MSESLESPSASVSASYLPPASEFPPATYPYQHEQDSDPGGSSSHHFGSSQPYKTSTTLLVKGKKEVEIHSAHRALQLARVRRETCTARLEYRILRMHEINTMHAFAQHESNEAVTLNENVEYQSPICGLDATRAAVQEEYHEALTLLKRANLEVEEATGALVSMGEQIPPAFSRGQRASQTSSRNSCSRSVSPDSHSMAV